MSSCRVPRCRSEDALIPYFRIPNWTGSVACISKTLHSPDSKNYKSEQGKELGDKKGWLRAGRSKLVQKPDLLEGLDDTDEDIQV